MTITVSGVDGVKSDVILSGFDYMKWQNAALLSLNFASLCYYCVMLSTTVKQSSWQLQPVCLNVNLFCVMTVPLLCIVIG